jgi:hypothetical protein
MLVCSVDSLLGRLDNWTFRRFGTTTCHGLEYCMLSFYFILLPAATRLDPFAR